MEDSGDRFKRTRLLVGQEGLERLNRAKVLVIGLGAVGGFAVEALARSGIGKFHVIDCDRVEISNCNRQLYALSSTIGQPKADLAKARILDINPACEVDSEICYVDRDQLPRIIQQARPDAIVDAIDSLSSKVELLLAATKAGIPVFSSMGAARKRNPSLIRVADISRTSVCPLAAAVRQRLRKNGVVEGVTCVYSTEIPPADSVERTPKPERPGADHQRPALGSLPSITGIFGLTLASAVIEAILG